MTLERDGGFDCFGSALPPRVPDWARNGLGRPDATGLRCELIALRFMPSPPRESLPEQ
jgi:hypothetical protein